MTHADEESQEGTEADAQDSAGGQGGDEEPQGGPTADELHKDPAYEPDDENLKGLKGG